MKSALSSMTKCFFYLDSLFLPPRIKRDWATRPYPIMNPKRTIKPTALRANIPNVISVPVKNKIIKAIVSKKNKVTDVKANM